MRTLLLAFCVVALCVVPAAAQLAPREVQQKGSSSVGLAEDEQLQRYRQIWDATRPKIESGIIHYKQASGGNFDIVDHAKIRGLLKRMSERDDYSSIIRELACTLKGVKVPDAAPDYPELVLYFKGTKVRREWRGEVDIFDGTLSVKTRPVNAPAVQITISDKRSVAGFSDLYHVPSAEMGDALICAAHQPEGDRLEISPDKSAVERLSIVVAKTGDVLEVRSGSKESSSEDVYSAFKEFDGVRLPQLIFKGTYNEGKLAFASISAIADAQFNVKIDDNIFVQDVKAGDVIVNNLNGGQAVSRAKHDADNVLNTRAWSKSD